MDIPALTRQNIEDIEYVATWLGRRIKDDYPKASSVSLRLIRSLGAQRAGALILQKVRSINESDATYSAGETFLDYALTTVTMVQKLITAYSQHLDRIYKKPLLYNFVERLFDEEPQIFLFADMTSTDVDTANRELNVPKIKDRTKKEVNEKIAALRLLRVRHARSLQPDGTEVGEYVADFSDVGDEEPVPVSKKESRKRPRTPVSSDEEDFEEDEEDYEEDEEDYEVGDCDADDLFDDEASEPSDDASFSPRLPKKRFRSLYDDFVVDDDEDE